MCEPVLGHNDCPYGQVSVCVCVCVCGKKRIVLVIYGKFCLSSIHSVRNLLVSQSVSHALNQSFSQSVSQLNSQSVKLILYT